jgi:hypothetical protein
MTARRRVLALAGAATVALGAGVASGVAGQRDGPRAPIPRVCWFSDYANAKLSNKCDYRSEERRWYMEVDGAMVPADTQKLPVANLCLYFSGTTCPKK